ncbi:MAG TPA: Ig-like domain-containing protein, partial [Amycolatopsis sp.]|nr:Ig-like domain-containing protein [Amycolatopsis sp.]
KVARAGSKTRLRKAGAGLVSLRVTPAAAGPTGKVKLMKGPRVLKTVRLKAADNGRRTVKLPQLAKGTHKIRAVYVGNKSLKKSASKVLRLTLG